uniref:Uncharacterized protein n=1 Tax=Anguilla anguilla TaxID=7936 RepID=A0A0E9S1Y8_ANGAN
MAPACERNPICRFFLYFFPALCLGMRSWLGCNMCIIPFYVSNSVYF